MRLMLFFNFMLNLILILGLWKETSSRSGGWQSVWKESGYFVRLHQKYRIQFCSCLLQKDLEYWKEFNQNDQGTEAPLFWGESERTENVQQRRGNSERILSMCINIRRKSEKKTEPCSFQWYPTSGQETMGKRWTQEVLSEYQGALLHCAGSGTLAPKEFVSPPSLVVFKILMINIF